MDQTQSIYDQAKSYLESNPDLLSKEERLKALDNFLALGIPNKKQEDYKYCNLQKYVPQSLVINQDLLAHDQVKTPQDVPSKYVVHFIDGAYHPESSLLPEGLSLKICKHPYRDSYTDAMEALCDAMTVKYCMTVKDKQTIPLTTIHHTFTHKSSMSFARLTIHVGKLSSSSFIESFIVNSQQDHMINAHTCMEIEAGARVKHQKVVIGGSHDHLVTKVSAILERDAHLNGQTFSTGASMARNNIEVQINDEGAHATVNGLFATRSEQLHDNFSHIAHNVGHTTSEQIFKGILDDKSKGAFTGKIVIHRDAQLVDSSQLNKNLLLDKKAHVDTRPQLEVYADDVKCAHGATVGQISEEEVFYLESRGIEKTSAQKILCHAFAKEVFNSCEDESLSTWLDQKLYGHFEQYALDKMS